MRHGDSILRELLPDPAPCGTLLDCAAGMGTQAIGLADMGYTVEGSDGSETSITHAKCDAERRGLAIPFRVDDLRRLEHAHENFYGAAIALDNAFPHLGTEFDMRAAATAILSRLRPGGVLLTGIRDYDPVLETHPAVMPPHFSGNGSGRRIFHEVWDWHDERRYTAHVYVTNEVARHWQVMHFTGNYCAILKCELANLLRESGFAEVQIFGAEQTGFHQPLLRARKT
ncbi:MAG TPA: class I SAM-dependent methyltransferase [Candidatus Koribacter sp.]|jgi:hypothetical protein